MEPEQESGRIVLQMDQSEDLLSQNIFKEVEIISCLDNIG
jgi:hypothetical protein